MFARADVFGGGAFEFLLVFTFWVVHFGLPVLCFGLTATEFVSLDGQFSLRSPLLRLGSLATSRLKQLCLHTLTCSLKKWLGGGVIFLTPGKVCGLRHSPSPER